MTNFKRKLLAVAMTGFVSAGAFAQKKGEDRRPPKPNTRVVVEPKRGEKPPQNNKQSDKRNDGKKKGRG